MTQRTVVFRAGAAYHGLTMGMALAMILSFARNGSILFAILHGILSWIYVVYYALSR
jgi:hypothetical protein